MEMLKESPFSGFHIVRTNMEQGQKLFRDPELPLRPLSQY